jgi:hypothetical protein
MPEGNHEIWGYRGSAANYTLVSYHDPGWSLQVQNRNAFLIHNGSVLGDGSCQTDNVTASLEQDRRNEIANARTKANEEAKEALEAAATARTQRLADAEAAKIKAQNDLKIAQEDAKTAAAEKQSAEETAKTLADLAAQAAENAAVRQHGADARKAAADAMAKAKDDAIVATQKEHDAEAAEKIAKAPAAPPARQWWIEVEQPTHTCVVSTSPSSPAKVVDQFPGARITDTGAYVTVTGADEAFLGGFYRTKDACDKVVADKSAAADKEAHKLDDYR